MHNQKLTLTDSIVLVVTLTLTLSLLNSAILRQRSVARSEICSSQLKQIGLAIHNYHAAYNMLPPGLSGSEGGTDSQSNQGRLGPLVGMLPFLEQQKLWETISSPFVGATTKTPFARMGPAPWYNPGDYLPWGSMPASLICPENGNTAPASSKSPKVVTSWEQLATELTATGLHATSYVACFGDGTQRQGKKGARTSPADAMEARASQRGVFASHQVLRIRDILDGTSYTLMYSEAVSDSKAESSLSKIAANVVGLSQKPSLCLSVDRKNHRDWFEASRGSRWADGALAITGFQTVLPPNSPSCLSEIGLEEPIASASSHHAGGVHVLFADGRVAFVANEIDCGSLTSPGVGLGKGYTQPGSKSPYGIWGGLGSRASKETPALEPHVMPIAIPAFTQRVPLETWKDNSGKKQLAAKFIRVIDKATVELEGQDGNIYRLPLNSLSNSDILRAVKKSVAGKSE